MCNLERLRSGPADIRQFFDIDQEFDFTGNLEAGDIYPRRSGPVVRRREDYEAWLTADWKKAKALQRAFPAEKMEICRESP